MFHWCQRKCNSTWSIYQVWRVSPTNGKSWNTNVEEDKTGKLYFLTCVKMSFNTFCYQGFGRSRDISEKSHPGYQVDDQEICWCQVWILVLLPKSQGNGWRRGFILYNWGAIISSWGWKYRIQVCNFFW